MKLHMTQPQIKKQRGSGLIEMLVSMVIGLILIIGIGTVFFSVNNIHRDRQGLSNLQNSQRLAMSFISSAIYNAGYYPNPLAVSPIASNQALVGTESGTSDTLTIRFVAPSGTSVTPFQGCTAALTPGNVYSNTFSVSAGNLVCTQTNITTSTTTAVNLITGLSGLDIVYGVDTTGDGSAETYRNASTATWGNVKTVRVTLSFTNPLSGQGQQATTSLTQTISSLTGP